MTTIRLLSEQDLRATDMTLDEVLTLVEHAYRQQSKGEADVPTKIGVHPSYPNSFLHAMPAWVGGEEQALGLKWISYYPGNSSSGLSDSTGVILLNDPDSGHPLCVMEGMYLTFVRTAACAAVMAKHFTHRPRTLGLIGCGGLGEWSLRLMCHAFPTITSVWVNSRRAESRESFSRRFSTSACAAHATQTVEQVMARSDIVISSVPPSDTPPITRGMLRKGQLYIPLDLTNAWQAAAIDDVDLIVADNVEGFPAVAKRRFGRDILHNKPLLSIQSLLLEDQTATPTHRADCLMLAVCGIASVDMVLALRYYQRANAAERGGFFKMR